MQNDYQQCDSSRGNYFSYARRVIDNACANLYRDNKNKVRTHFSLDEKIGLKGESRIDLLPSQEDQLGKSILADEVQEVFQHLSPHERRACELLEEVSCKTQVCKKLGMSRSRFHRSTLPSIKKKFMDF